MAQQIPENLSYLIKSTLLALLIALNIELDKLGYLLILIFVDSFFGMLRAWRLNEGVSFSVFIWGITSKFMLLLIPFLIAGFGLVFKIPLTWIVVAFIYLLSVNDLISIFANAASIKTKAKVKNVDFIVLALNSVREIFEKKAKDILKNLGKE